MDKTEVWQVLKKTECEAESFALQVIDLFVFE